MQNYSELLRHWKKIEVLRSTVGVLHWDMETYMPDGSIGLRQEQLSLAAQLEHSWVNDKNFTETILSDKVTPQNAIEKRNLALWKKGILVSSSIDTKLLDRFTRVSSECNHKWRSAKANSNFSEVKDLLKELVDLSREQLQRIKANPALKELYADKSLYEISFDQYEPGMPLAEMQTLLSDLCEETKKKLPQYIENTKKRAELKPINTQLINRDFCEALMRTIGFDFNHGRLDSSAHPFSGGYPGDVRITVRKESQDPLEDLLSTLHEVGHALYEQGLPAETIYEPSGKHCSMGVHESQSRFIENIIGRSQAFCDSIASKLETGSENLFNALNPLKIGFIRVDSDEVTYNLHIMLRFEIERDLMEGKLEVKDLPERWNSRFKELMGLTVEKDSLGCLQDTHWYSGAFGYFPSYSLGNMFSAELFAEFKKTHPDWEDRVRKGELKFVRDFMAQKVYPLAFHYDSPECMHKIIGRKVSEKALLNYFDSKFG
ncbi:MAG: carboxypeptidase M32 [Bdellovibrionota bacterium]